METKDVFKILAEARAAMKIAPPTVLEPEEFSIFEEKPDPEPAQIDLTDYITTIDHDATAMVVGNFKPTQEIEILESADSMIAKARALNASIGRSYLDLGRICRAMIVQGIHEEKGYKDLPEFFEKEIDLHYRKARYLITIADRVDEVGISEDKILTIGWSKSKEIVNAPNSMIPALIDHAKDMSIEQIKAEIKKTKNINADATEPNRSKMTMYFFNDQLDVINNAIELGTEVYNTDNPALTLYKIVSDWSVNQRRAPNYEAMVAYMRDTYNVDVVPREEV